MYYAAKVILFHNISKKTNEIDAPDWRKTVVVAPRTEVEKPRLRSHVSHTNALLQHETRLSSGPGDSVIRGR